MYIRVLTGPTNHATSLQDYSPCHKRAILHDADSSTLHHWPRKQPPTHDTVYRIYRHGGVHDRYILNTLESLSARFPRSTLSPAPSRQMRLLIKVLLSPRTGPRRICTFHWWRIWKDCMPRRGSPKISQCSPTPPNLRPAGRIYQALPETITTVKQDEPRAPSSSIECREPWKDCLKGSDQTRMTCKVHQFLGRAPEKGFFSGKTRHQVHIGTGYIPNLCP